MDQRHAQVDPPTVRLPRIPAQRRTTAVRPPHYPAGRAPIAPRRRRWPQALLVGAVAVLLLGVLGAMVSDGGTGETPVVSAATPILTQDEQFILVVEGQGIDVTDADTFVDGARLVCVAVDEGASPAQVALSLAGGTSLSLEDAGFVTGAALATYCPEHRDLLGS